MASSTDGPDLTGQTTERRTSEQTGESRDWSGLDRQVRLGAKALLHSDGRVLLVRERRTDGSTFWTLPGGGVEPGESHRECLRRELREELRCRPAIGRMPVAACRYRHTTLEDTVTIYAVFPAGPVSDPAPNFAEGIVACAWCHPADPPGGTLSPFRDLLHSMADDRE